MITIHRVRLWDVLRAIAAIALAGVIAGCGGGASGGDSAGSSGSASRVLQSESPLPDTSGVAASLQDGSQVYALDSADLDTSRISIAISTDLPSADLSQMVGGAAIEFKELPSTRAMAVVRTGAKVSRVYECNSAARICKRIQSAARLASGEIAFSITPGNFYVLERRQ